jgi:hypothetical protein
LSDADRLFTEDFSTEPWWWSGFWPPTVAFDPP